MVNPQRIKPKTTPAVKLMRPFQEFAGLETSGGIVLLACTLIALVWANSPWAAAYTSLWHTTLAVQVGSFNLSKDLHFWINDALMAVFFFVVGLEIKRQLIAGELASPRRAALPIVAALGGVLVPALLYLSLNGSGPGGSGWGIPMATDIAFAIGVMALLGDRVPVGLQIFLTALAIVDDIAAILVIAVFYTADLNGSALGAAAFFFVVALAANRLGVRHPFPYALIGMAVWMALLVSGIHATLAGVLMAFIIPGNPAVGKTNFVQHGRWVLDHFERAAQAKPASILNGIEQQIAVEALVDACEKVQPPLHRLERDLHPWVTFMIMPIFALANAGVALSGDAWTMIAQPVSLGVILGLVIGKPLGIMLAAGLAVKSGLASLPKEVSWRHIHGASWLAGIGFTMSLFMAGLAFTDQALLTESKLGILLASLCAGIAGSGILLRAPRAAKPVAD